MTMGIQSTPIIKFRGNAADKFAARRAAEASTPPTRRVLNAEEIRWDTEPAITTTHASAESWISSDKLDKIAIEPDITWGDFLLRLYELTHDESGLSVKETEIFDGLCTKFDREFCTGASTQIDELVQNGLVSSRCVVEEGFPLSLIKLSDMGNSVVKRLKEQGKS